MFSWHKQPDAHTGSHLFGSFFLVHAASHFAPELWQAFVIAVTLGFLHELMDEYHGDFLPKFYDPRGGDWGDICVNIIGASLALII